MALKPRPMVGESRGPCGGPQVRNILASDEGAAADNQQETPKM